MVRNYNTALLDQEWSKIAGQVVTHLNSLESFAIPFAEGVADEEIGYRETARTFCQLVEASLCSLFHLRRLGNARYESTIKLYTAWSQRLVAEGITLPKVQKIEQILPNFETSEQSSVKR